MKEKLIEADLIKARRIGKSSEFIATFGAILSAQMLFGIFLLSFGLGIFAYAVTNGILETSLQKIKSRIKF